MNAGPEDDRLGGSGDALAQGRDDKGPLKRFTAEDRGESPAEHLPNADPEVARRLAGADTGTLRRQGEAGDDASGNLGGRDPDRPPIYQGATSADALGGEDAGISSMTGTERTGGPTPGKDDVDLETGQPPRRGRSLS